MQYLAIYYCIISFVLFMMMWMDKKRAIKNRWRIPESYLFIVALLGGAVGGFAGIFAFRHKTKKIYFHIIYFLAIVLHIAFIYMLATNFFLK